MKKIAAFSLLGILLMAHTAVAQTGVIFKYKISSSAGATGSLTGYYSDGNFRSEMNMEIPQMPGGGMSTANIIQKDKPKLMLQLNDKNKTYTEVEIKDRPDTAKGAETTVKVIGNEKIGKYNCIHSQVTQNNKVSEYWTTRDIPEYEKYANAHRGNRFMGRGNTSAALKNANADGFLVKTFGKDMRGNETSVELESFENGPVSADKFVIPDGYTKTAGTEPGAPGMAPGMDYNKLKDMSPEERKKFIDDLKKQHGGGN
ncbi:MAG TPA: DUF4412 domain-containing protein [Bacteroidia bacterium]|jgi:hypothetical protein|nr:DUF4412 domain-containing protein [Bacteroidia bacterium]